MAGRLISRGWLVLLSGFALTAASHSLVVTFGSWLEDEFGMTPAGLSVVTFVLGAGELTATLCVARYTDVWGKRRSIAARRRADGAGERSGWRCCIDHLAIGVILLTIAVLGLRVLGRQRDLARQRRWCRDRPHGVSGCWSVSTRSAER